VPAESQLHKQIVRKDVEGRVIEMDPVLKLHYVELEKPDLHNQASDHERLLRALAEQWSLHAIEIAPAVLRTLPRALDEGAMTATVAIRDGRLCCAVWPGLRERAHGLAVDVGTTTIAVHLCDLASGEVVATAGAMNPQIRFGEDVMSRLSYIQQNTADADRPTAVVRDAIDRLAVETAHQAGIASEDILELAVVGNPTMHHFLLGLDALQLGRAPFPLVTDKAVTLPASAIDLSLHPECRVYVLPCIAGHVGADTSGVVLSEAPHLAEETMLIVDIGTNAEIVLGSTERLLACSSPTGPAFEGGQISCGQRAAPGAIERVRVDPETLAPRFSVIGSALWSDEPGFEASIAGFGVTGICGSGIIEAIAEMFRAGIVKPSGLIDGAMAARSGNVVAEGRAFAYRLWAGPPAILVTQTDIRAIQLAKAALYAGAQLLMERLGITCIERIVLAGAFGSTIDVRHAMTIGMLPDCRVEQVHSAGNAAGTGARIALLNGAARSEIETVARRIEKIETAAEPRFQRYFVDAMAFPHADHSFPKLEQALTGAESIPPADA